MDPIYEILPHFSLVQLTETSAGLLSEHETYLVYGQVLVQLLSLVDAGRTESELLDGMKDIANPAETFFHLNRLITSRFIREAPLEPTIPGAFTRPAPMPPDCSGRIVDLGTDPRVSPLLWEGCASLDPHELPVVVITDDYFDPRLAEFAVTARARGISWIPLKAVGEQPWFGPRFGGEGDPCFDCLIARLKRNRCIEAWYIEQNPSRQPLYLSRHRTDQSLKAAVVALLEDQMVAGGGSANHYLVSVDPGSGTLTRHRTGEDELCPLCAVSRDEAPMSRPLYLQSRPNLPYRENGLRTRQSEETMKLLEPFVSPLTGIVQTVEPLSGMPEVFGFPHLARFSVPIDAGFFDRKKALVPAGGNGKGFSITQGRLSAVCEGIERVSAYYYGTEPTITAAFAVVADRAVTPFGIYGCSEAEYISWSETRDPDPFVGPGRFSHDRPLKWTPAWSLTKQQPRLVPPSFVYFSVPPEDLTHYADAASNGLASGNVLEEALLHGLTEVIERDAATIWWCSQARVPQYDLDAFNSAEVLNLRDHLDSIGWDFYVLDLTHDLGIPVAVAVARHRSNLDEIPRMGFGSDLDPMIAITRAVSELGQSWFWMPRFRLNDYCLLYDSEPLWAKEYILPEPGAVRTPGDFPQLETGDLKHDIELVVNRLAEQGLEALAVNLTRPGYGLYVTRVIVPGLCRFWPRFATPRLVETPFRAGWLPDPLAPENQNRIPFFYSNCGMRLEDWTRK